MNKRWQEWDSKWNELTARERIMLLVVGLVAPLALIFVFLIEPAMIVLQKVPSKIEAMQTSIDAQDRVLQLLKSQEPKDPNVEARAELKRLRTQLSEANQDIKRAATNLVSPDQMLTLLRSVLANQQGIALVSAKSLPVVAKQLNETPVDADKDTKPVGPQAVIFIHPFELELEGTYQGLYDYLQKIEQLDGVFFWDTLEYKVDEYPTAKVKIKVHTLSSEAGWLGA
ncbi:type II secretion system protein GspM [Neptuniibacter sp. QD37_11]|uniref:type II secretion system protein GspM n=1 Tax=Neptuniibacter sp. QD37_11 TaxID=3398209 RepID=UPI0039F4BD44